MLDFVRHYFRPRITSYQITFVIICPQDAKNRGDADGFEISYNRLNFEREIGHGAFGQVFLAKAEAIRGVPGTRLVAVKKLKGNLDQFQKPSGALTC